MIRVKIMIGSTIAVSTKAWPFARRLRARTAFLSDGAMTENAEVVMLAVGIIEQRVLLRSRRVAQERRPRGPGQQRGRRRGACRSNPMPGVEDGRRHENDDGRPAVRLDFVA